MALLRSTSAQADRANLPCAGDYGLFAGAMRRSVVDGVTTYTTSWTGCTSSATQAQEAVAVAKSVGAGDVPAWFVENFQNSDGTWKHEDIWSTTKSNARLNTVLHFSNSFGGYCASLSDVKRWMQSGSSVTNPWNDGGCTPTVPTDTGVVSGTEKLTASWSAPDDAGGAPVNGYAVEWKKSSVTGWNADVTRVEVEASSTSYVITGVTSGQE